MGKKILEKSEDDEVKGTIGGTDITVEDKSPFLSSETLEKEGRSRENILQSRRGYSY